MTGKSLHCLFLHPMIRPDQGPQHPPYGILELMAMTDQLGYKVGFIDNNALQLPIDALRQEIRGHPQPKMFKYNNLDIQLNPNGTFTADVKKFVGEESATKILSADLIEGFCKKLAEEVKRLSLTETKWDIIGIGGLTTQTKYIMPLAKVCREEHPEALIVAGGGFLSSMPFEMMKWIPEIDIGVIGEAYHTWPAVLEMYQSGKNWSHVKGLVYRENKKIKLSGMRPLLTEEEMDDEIPWPDYDVNHTPTETYLRYSAIPYSPESTGMIPLNLQEPLRRLDVRASLGCSWQCKFCHHVCGSPSQQAKLYGKKVMGKPFRHNSPKYVVGLMANLRSRYGVNFVSFIDENFTTDRQWFLDFCAELEQQDLAGLICWGVVGHTRTVDQTMLTKGRDVGMRYISYGGESGSKKILTSIGKGQTPEQMTSAIEATHAAQINPIMSFIVGFPDETIDDIIATCQFFIDNQIHCDPFLLQPYPATAYYDEFKDKIIEQHYTENELIFLGELHNGAPSPLDLKAIINSPDASIRIKDEDINNITPAWCRKNKDFLEMAIKETALKRWVLSLDDATRMSCNISQFNDVELAGLKYMLATWDIERLKAFKKQLQEEGEGDIV